MAETYTAQFAIGDQVVVDNSDITGTVDSVRFHALGAVYSVEWFHNGAQQTGQFHGWRLCLAPGTEETRPPAQVGERGLMGKNGINYATFHAFKPSGKWYTSDRARLDPSFFREFPEDRRKFLLELMPDGNYPGLASNGAGFVWVIIPDEDHENGFPIMLPPPKGRS